MGFIISGQNGEGSSGENGSLKELKKMLIEKSFWKVSLITPYIYFFSDVFKYKLQVYFSSTNSQLFSPSSKLGATLHLVQVYLGTSPWLNQDCCCKVGLSQWTTNQPPTKKEEPLPSRAVFVNAKLKGVFWLWGQNYLYAMCVGR